MGVVGLDDQDSPLIGIILDSNRGVVGRDCICANSTSFDSDDDAYDRNVILAVTVGLV